VDVRRTSDSDLHRLNLDQIGAEPGQLEPIGHWNWPFQPSAAIIAVRRTWLLAHRQINLLPQLPSPHLKNPYTALSRSTWLTPHLLSF
jgi:hypothetical protein